MANIIAVVWDFDKTLVDGYMQDPIFEEYGVDPKKFWKEVNELPAALPLSYVPPAPGLPCLTLIHARKEVQKTRNLAAFLLCRTAGPFAFWLIIIIIRQIRHKRPFLLIH